MFLLQTLGALDVVYKMNPIWVLANGVVALVLAYIGKLFSKQLKLDNIFAGARLIEAEQFLVELDQFSREA